MKVQQRVVAVAVLALAVLALGGLLLLRATAPAPTVLEANTDRHTVRVTAQPPTAGTTAVEVELTAAAGVTAVRLEPTMAQMGHALPPVVADPVPGDRDSYRADVALPMPGSWQVHVVIDDAHGTERLPTPLVLTR